MQMTNLCYFAYFFFQKKRASKFVYVVFVDIPVLGLDSSCELAT